MREVVTVLLAGLFLFGSVWGAADEDGFFGPNLLRKNPDVTVYRAHQSGVPRYVEGRLSEQVNRGDEATAALSFFETHKDAYRMEDPTSELKVRRLDVDELQMRHLRLDQMYRDLRVIGGDLIVHFTSEGIIKAVNGTYYPEIDLDVNPLLSEGEAVRVATDDLQSFFGSGNPGTPELVVFLWEGDEYLCWQLFILSDTPMGRWEYLVDARTGEVVFKANRIMDTDAIGTGISVMGDPRNHIDTDFNGSNYRMIDNTRQLNNDPHGHGGEMPAGNNITTNIAGSTLPGSVATDADNYWDVASSQRPAVDGHVYTALVYDYLLGHFDRNSYDDAGHSMLTIVNYSGDGDNNAYWDGSRIVVWSWSSGWRSLASCPDVIAHEWGHAVTEYTSGLVYQKEPGALNESFSDMIGAAFEFAHDTLDTPDWLMGENGQTSGAGFRDMENPHNFGDPDFYGTSDPYWIDVVNCTPSWMNDYCGVHTNSGVGNKWFFLLSDGGTHHSVTVAGIGVQNAMAIAYRANAFYWNSSTDYHEAALATLTAADDLDSTGQWSYQASLAWNAVGVSTPTKGLAFDYPSGVPTTVAPDTTTTFEVVVTGQYGGQPDPGSGKIHYRIDGGTWAAQDMTETSPNNYDAVLPAVPCSSSIEFYVSARELTLGAITDPDPADPHSAIPATSVTVVFDDDFETDQGWTVSGTVADGQWERGIPIGGGDRGDPPTDFDGSGRCYLTDNVDDNSDVDGGTTILMSPTFDLSGGDAIIHYARWYSNDFGAAPNTDTFKVYISNNNGSSWTLVENVGPVDQASGGWFENDFWASAYVTPTAQMKVRFDAADLGDGSVVEAGVDDFTVTQYTCEFEGGPPIIATTNLSDWTVNIPYSEQLSATGGQGALTWTDKYSDLAGTGLSLSSSGLLSGTPTTEGTISFTAEVMDEALQNDERVLSFDINPAVVISTSTLPDWTAGHPYSQQLMASGGTGALTWSDKNNDLIGSGLSLSGSGLLSGTAVSGAVSFTAEATDDVGATDETGLAFTVNPTVSITTSTLPDWTEGIPYSQQLTSTGGTGTHTWSDKNGDLAGTGLTLSALGLLSGIPASSGSVNFTAEVADEVGATNNQTLGFTVNAAVNITSTTLPDWTVGRPYSQQLTHTGGTGSVTWTDKNGELTSTGLSLSSGGLLSGSPGTEGPISFTAEVADQIGSVDEQLLTFAVNPPVSMTTTSLPDWTEGEPYSQQLTAEGGTGVKTWVDQNGDLSGTGLTLSSDGLLSGVPATGPVSFTAEVTDETGDSDEGILTCMINAAIAITTDSVPDGDMGEAYSHQLAATGGTGNLTWSDLNGDLAAYGLSLSSAGFLAGACADTGQVSFTAHIDDDIGATGEKLFSFYIKPDYICGDVDNNGDDPNVTDLSYLVDYLFRGGPPPPILEAADLDGNGDIEVVDLTYLVDYLFKGGPEPVCP